MSGGRAARPPDSPRAVIFDFDGVIADTEWLHSESFTRVLAEEGIRVDGEDHASRFLGINDRAAFTKAFEEVGRVLPPEACTALIARKSGYYRGRLGEAPIFPGVPELLEGLAALRPLAIGSGGRKAEIETVLAAHGLRRWFVALLSADEVARSKPAPDTFLQALEGIRRAVPRLAPELAAADCLVIEDSLPGVEAALAAGMRCLAVAHTYPPEQLARAHRVVERIGDLRPEDVIA